MPSRFFRVLMIGLLSGAVVASSRAEEPSSAARTPSSSPSDSPEDGVAAAASEPGDAASKARAGLPPEFHYDGSHFLGIPVETEWLTGDWYGLRAWLGDHGLRFDLHTILEYSSVLDGGVRRSSDGLGTASLVAAFDPEPSTGWKGATLTLHGLGTWGSEPSDSVGDFQATSNIEADSNWTLFEAWLDQVLFSGVLSIRAGLYAVDGEFQLSSASALFLNSSFGPHGDFAAAGRNGPSIFPQTSAGLRALLRPNDHLYAQAAILDGVSGDPGDARGFQLSWQRRDGLLLVGEVGVDFGPEDARDGDAEDWDAGDWDAGDSRRRMWLPPRGKWAIGAWGFTALEEDLSALDAFGRPELQRGTQGWYALGQQTVWRQPEGDSGLSVFGRLGFADDRVLESSLFAAAGLVVDAPLPGRSSDHFGVAATAVRASRHHLRALARDGAASEPWEVALEMTYRARVFPWLDLQPSLHYVFHPGFDASLEDALVVAVRAYIAF